MIALINPPGLKTFSGLNMHTPNPPIGLAYIAAALKASGRDYQVIDGTGEALDRIVPYPGRDDFLMQGLSPGEIVERIRPGTAVIGIGCMFSTLWPLARMVAEEARAKFPEALLVLGGEHGTAVPEHVLRTSPIDVVVMGEGEETFARLLQAVDTGGDFAEVDGITFLDKGQPVHNGLSARIREVDDIRPPDWDSFPIEDYISRNQINGINLGRSIPMLATRGCPYRCTFCSNPNMWTQRYIPRDPKQLVDEIEANVAKYNLKNVDFQDLTAIVNRRWAVEFCSELISRNLGITWQMPSGTRCEVFDEEVVDLLYRSGCRALAFAPESGDPQVLARVEKQVDLDKLMEAARIAVARGLKLSCFLVIGFPGDAPDNIRKSMALLRKLALLGVHDVLVTKFVPYPGSRLFKELQASGKIELDDKFFVSPMDFYNSEAPSYAEAISMRRLYFTMLWMFVNFYIISFLRRPLRVTRILTVALFTGVEETRYAKWFVDRIRVRRRWKKAAQNRA